MMFGIPGAALAMVHTAKPAKRKIVIGLVASAAISAFVCGVTEPFEFGFMFLAPVLYVIYAYCMVFSLTITTLLDSAQDSCSQQVRQTCYSQHPFRLLRNMDDHSSWNRSIHRILRGVPLRNREVQLKDSGTRG